MYRIDLVLTENFPALSLTLLTEPLRVANRESLEEVFAWRCLSLNGGKVRSSSGIEIPTTALDTAGRDAVIVLSSYSPETSLTRDFKRWLRAEARRGTLMGCVDTAALIFAEAGLLTSQPAAAHFEALPGYLAHHPERFFIDRLYDFSPPRCSSAGGVATMDMTLALIRHVTDDRLARRVSQILTYIPPDHPGVQERLLSDHALAHVNRELARAIDLMFATLHAPLSMKELSAHLGLPPWRLGQVFKRYLRTTPAAHYRQLRLDRARNLLRNSHHAVGDIGALCGFDNHETFTRAYARTFGHPPSADREI